MKHKTTFIIAVFAGIIFSSCKKEKSCESCRKPPTAVAGPDRLITLPTDSVALDGSASSDPDGVISSWLWTKISGPASIHINSASTSKTIVKSFVTGTYQFELMVTDNDGLFAKDTVQITLDGIATNHPPVANAGADQTITLPTHSVTIDGNGSTDPDNNIASYEWTKIFGPSSFSIFNANTSQTQVVNLAEGIYLFELKVTDLGGLFSKDTIKVTVIGQTLVPFACDNSLRPLINAQLTPFTTLPSGTGRVFTTIGNKVYFLTVECINCNDSTKAKAYYNIFDLNTQTWSRSRDHMINPRKLGTIVAAGNKIYYAGGYNGIVNVYSTVFSNIDIYDITSDTWSSSSLSVGRCNLSGIVIEDKILFAGGFAGTSFIPSDRVDIYQLSTGIWSTASLSQARGDMSAVTTNNKIYFAGGSAGVNAFTIGYLGATDRIDIYDNSTGSWSVSALVQEKTMMSSVSVGNKIFWAGGLTSWEDWKW